MAIQAKDSNWTDLKVILGVDRLDYTKGLVNRLYFTKKEIMNPKRDWKTLLLALK